MCVSPCPPSVKALFRTLSEKPASMPTWPRKIWSHLILLGPWEDWITLILTLASEMTQWVMALTVTKLNHPAFNPRPHEVQGESNLSQVVLWPPRRWAVACLPATQCTNVMWCLLSVNSRRGKEDQLTNAPSDWPVGKSIGHFLH